MTVVGSYVFHGPWANTHSPWDHQNSAGCVLAGHTPPSHHGRVCFAATAAAVATAASPLAEKEQKWARGVWMDPGIDPEPGLPAGRVFLGWEQGWWWL